MSDALTASIIVATCLFIAIVTVATALVVL